EADRRWSRSAVTASGSTGPTRCIPRGINSSIPTASREPRSWPSPVRTADWSWRRTIGWTFPRGTVRIRSGSRAATARRIRSAIRRLDREQRGLGIGRTLARGHCERPLSRGEPWHGLAARRLRRADGTELACPGGGAWAARGRPSARDARGDLALLAADQPRLLAAADPDRCQPAGHRVRCVPFCQQAASAGAGADTTDTTGAVVFCRRDRARRGIDARADLSRALPRRQFRRGP